MTVHLGDGGFGQIENGLPAAVTASLSLHPLLDSDVLAWLGEYLQGVHPAEVLADAEILAGAPEHYHLGLKVHLQLWQEIVDLCQHRIVHGIEILGPVERYITDSVSLFVYNRTHYILPLLRFGLREIFFEWSIALHYCSLKPFFLFDPVEIEAAAVGQMPPGTLYSAEHVCVAG